jgi:hypothetical protein
LVNDKINHRMSIDIQVDGYWVGNYGNNGHELVELQFNTEKKQILAKKITGDKKVKKLKFRGSS